MSDPQPKRRGRPPKDPTTTLTSRGGFHLGLRFNEVRKQQLLACVEAANARAKAAGIPANVSPSSLTTLWIQERLDAETAKMAKKR